MTQMTAPAATLSPTSAAPETAAPAALFAGDQMLAIQGMTCAGCAGRVERALAAVPGVAAVSVNLMAERAHVAGAADPAALVEAVTRAGYQAQPVEDAAGAAAADADAARMRRRAGIEALLALLLTLPLTAAMIWHIPGWWQAGLATVVQFGLGWRFYRAGFAALRAGAGNMDLLVSLGTTAAYGLSLWHLAAAPAGTHPHLYFEAASAVIAFVLLGKWLEARAKGRASESLQALLKLKPAVAHLLVADDQTKDVPSAALQPGQRVLVRTGEAVPADGTVLKGRASMDLSLLTGESLPIEQGPGALVVAGAVNREGLLEVSITAAGGATMLAQIVRLVENAQAQKAPVQRLVDRVSAVFVPMVLLIAVVTFALHASLTGNLEAALLNAVAVLVIACPCALGLATPAALVAGTGAAARAGILIRDAGALEAAHAVTRVVFDKTGTLTTGKPEVTALHPASGQTAPEVAAIAAALQRASAHPLAAALRHHAACESLTLPAAEEVADHAGRGVSATIGGRRYAFGSRRFAVELGADLGALEAKAAAEEAAGRTVSWLVARDPAPLALAIVAFGDALKPRAAEAVARLKARGLKVTLLSGDSRGAAAAAAAKLGIDDVQAEVLPGGKARVIQAWQEKGEKVAMVGDGVNDAPALAAADCGIAFAAGADAAIGTAGITLLRNDPLLADAAIGIARATRATIRQNLFWAFAYNVVGLPLAAFGLLDPMAAGAAMALSSVSVVTNALRLARWNPDKETAA